MAAFPLPAGHPYASVRPGYAGFETTPAGSVINATASYVGASGDYPTNAITLQLFATQGGTWAVTTPFNLTVQTPAVNNAAYTSIIYTGGLRGSNYTFTSISLTPAQGATLGWLGTAPSVTLTIPGNTTTIASGYYLGGNAGAIYLTPVLDSTLTPIVQGITDYFFVCTTSAAYVSVDSIGTAIIPFPTSTTFAAGTTTPLNFTVQCRSNGILGQSSLPFTVNIVQPAVPTLTGVLSGNNVNLTFSSTTPGCTFDLSYGGAVTATGITSPYSYTTTTPGAYTFQVRASLCGLTTFSLPSTTTILPAQPAGVTSTVSGLTISLAWTSPVGTGYTYNVSRSGLAAQPVTVPTAQFTNLQVGSPTFYIQSVYAGIRSTTCNVQVSIPTTPPYNFRGSAVGSTITLSWANDTPGATFTLSSSSPTTLATQTSLTTPSYTYTNVAGGTYSFTVFSTSGGIPSTSATVAGLVALSAPTNFAVTTLGSTASLTWQNATSGATFNISYVVTSTLSSKAVVAGATTTSISSLPAGNYTFGIQSLVTGASSSFVTATGTIVAAPTSFKATSVGTTISLSWIESTAGCSFAVTNPTLGTLTTTNSNVQYTGVAGTSYTFTLTPCNAAAFVGPSVTTTGTVLSTPTPTAVLSGTNVDVSWTAVTGTSMAYTVSSSPGVPNPPAQPGSSRTVSFVSPPPAEYRFRVTAFDSSGNVSSTGTTVSLTVPVPQPINVGAKMSASSQIAVTWTETLPGCTFAFTGAPATTAASITNSGAEYTGVFNNPSPGGYTIAVVAASGGVSSIASVGVAVYTFFPFNVTLSAACSQSGSTNNITAAYLMSSPAAIYGAGVNGGSPYVANVAYSGLILTPSITLGTAGLGGDYGSGFWGSANSIINAVPATFPVNFVVPPTSLTVTANGTNLLVKWADSTTAGCRYTVVGTPGTFTCNVASGTGSTGVTFTGATIGTAYSFIITASSTGTYTASRQYAPDGGSVVTTENATIPYTITSVSVPTTAVTPINYPATFTAAATGTTIAINWSTVSGATGYTVFNGGSSLFTTTTATSCNYTGTVGQTYTLTVQANGPSSSNTNPSTITVTPLLPPTFSSFSQTGSSLAVGCAAPTGSSLSINTPTGLSAPTGTSTFNFTGGSGNTTYSFTVTATSTNASSSVSSAFTTLGTPAITSATAQGTATITVNWTYAGPDVSGFTIYSNTVSTATVGPTIRTATFAQSETTNNADTVYVVANGTIGSSIQSASVSVSDLVTAPTLTSSTVNGLGFTVQWTYATTARALSDFQVCNSTQTTLYSTVPYVANQLNYNSLFNVPSIAAYSFVVVGRDSVGSTISSAASTSVTPVAAPTIASVVQTGGTITLAATGTGLSTPTVTSTPTLTTASTGSPWAFTGAAGNTSYTFSITSTGTNATSTPATSNITTLATPLAPTLSSSGTTITVTWPAAGAYNIYSNTSLVTPATSNTTNATITSGITTGTTYTYTIALTTGGYTSLPSPSASITPVAAPSITSTLQNGTTITLTCATPATGVTLTIPNAPTPNYLTAGATTATTFKYTGYVAGTQFTFVVQSKNGNASNTASSTITPLYTPVMAYTSGTGTNLTLVWNYTGSVTGITFVLKDANNNWSGTSVTGASTAPFTTGVIGTPYSIYVYATSGGNQTPNSGTLNFTPIGVTTFTQDYQLTTQTQIVGNAYASSAPYYNKTTDSLNKLVPSVGSSPLIWTGATAANTYTGVYVQGTDGVSVSTAIGVTLYSAFSPTLISGCQVWYDGADPLGTGTPPGDGGAIPIWYNKGVGGSAYNARRVTGYSSASYSGVDRALSFNTSPITLYNTSYGVSPTTETIFIVFNVTNPSVTNNTLIGGLVSGGRGFGCGYTGAGAGTIGYLNMVNEWQSYVSGYASGTTAIATGQLAGGKTAVSLNGATLTTPAAYAAYTGVGTTHLGAQITSGNTYSYNGLAMEIIIYNAALNKTQIQTVQGYLAWKWGLQANLPSANLYSSRYPGTYPLPSEYTGLALWFDAADLTTLFQDKAGTTAVTANGQIVKCWKDKSGNSRDARGADTIYTFGTGPTYSSNGFNGGYPGLLFGGTSNTILMTAALVPSTALAASGSNSTIFAVYNRSGTAGNGGVYGLQTTDNSFVLRDPWASAGSSILDLGSGTTARVAVTNTSVGPVVMSAYRSGTGTYLYQNTLPLGSNVSSTGTVSATSQGFCIGGGTVLSPVTFSSYISELIIYNTALTDTQRQSIETYLAYKWRAFF